MKNADRTLLNRAGMICRQMSLGFKDHDPARVALLQAAREIEALEIPADVIRAEAAREGTVLVPEEATGEIINAFWNVVNPMLIDGANTTGRGRLAWKEMVEASRGTSPQEGK